MEPREPIVYDYVEVLRRRKWSIMLPMATFILIAVAVAVLLPSIYQSTATILIEGQEIPADFVMTTVTSYVEQRLQTINQRIMSTSKLSEIIDRFGLYQELKGRWTTEEIIGKMREDIRFESISADVVDRRTGRPTTATIAFKLSYEGKTPNTVQKVAHMITSLYLEENLRVRKQQTMETSVFLEDEMEKVKVELTEIEKNISEFKEAHINELPEMFQVNIQTLATIERNIDRLEDQMRSLKEREGYLQSELASIPSQMEEGTDKRRLEELKMQLVNLRSQFSDEYPDVIKTISEIAELKRKIARMPGSSRLRANRPDNPAYVTLSSQLASTRTDIDSVRQQIRRLGQKAEDYRQRIEGTPKLEEEYGALVMGRRNTQAKLDDLMTKLLEAKVAYGLEEGQKGERFTLIEPPGLPEKPFKPNRKAIILIGIVLGIGAGIGTGALKEFADHSVRNPDVLAFATSFPVLGSVPEIVTKRDTRIRRIKRVSVVIGLILILAGGIAAFHYLIMDVNILWAKVLRKLFRHFPGLFTGE